MPVSLHRKSYIGSRQLADTTEAPVPRQKHCGSYLGDQESAGIVEAPVQRSNILALPPLVRICALVTVLPGPSGLISAFIVVPDFSFHKIVVDGQIQRECSVNSLCYCEHSCCYSLQQRTLSDRTDLNGICESIWHLRLKVFPRWCLRVHLAPAFVATSSIGSNQTAIPGQAHSLSYLQWSMTGFHSNENVVL